MAVALTLVDDVGTGTDAFGLAYPSTAFAAAKVYFVSAVMRTSSGSPDLPVPTLTNSSITTLTSALHPNAANRRFCVWQVTVSVDTTAILTIASSLSLPTQIGSHLVDGTGHNATQPLAQTPKRGDQALNVSSTFTITADNATTAGNAMLWMSGHDGYSQTPGTGFTQLADTIGAPETSEFTQWRATGDQIAEAVAPGADGLGSGLLMEITVDPGSSTSWRPNTVWFNRT
jgi:hypothetical protein